jgi:Na+-transporting methylmalonyl-CoA/oxaloacetate decarboxylase gamma subunit
LSTYSQGLMQGLTISIVGLLLAFLFMAIFIGVIVLLQKIFPYKGEEEGENGGEAPVVVAAAAGTEEEVVAAIAVALTSLGAGTK